MCRRRIERRSRKFLTAVTITLRAIRTVTTQRATCSPEQHTDRGNQKLGHPKRYGAPTETTSPSIQLSAEALHASLSRAAASRRHADASLDLFTRKSPRSWRDLSEKRALSARAAFSLVLSSLFTSPGSFGKDSAPFFVDGGSIN